MGDLRLTLAEEPAPVLPARALRVRNAYEGGALTRRTSTWHAPTVSPNRAVLSNLLTLRDRSRSAVRNDSFAKGAIDKLVSNLIGTGLKPLSQADDAEFRQSVHQRWARWTDESDADGLLDFYGQQAQAARAWYEGGEVFIRLRPRLPDDGLSVPLQMQVLEPELCPHTNDRPLLNGNRRVAGIEFDRIGRRVAYWFHPSRPELDDWDASQLRRIPASSVIHLFDPLRPGQLRGVPILTTTLVRLNELDKFDDATLLRQQVQNLFAGFITRPPQTGETRFDVLTGAEITDTDQRPLLSLEPAIMQELDPGTEIEFADPPDASQTYPDFMRQQLLAASTAHGVPYEVWTGDMRGVNDRVIRVVLQEFRRRIQAWQHQIIAFQLCRRVWRAWLDRAFLAGALPIPMEYLVDPEPWVRVKWMPQGWPYIHPQQDISAKKDEIRAGLTSRSATVSEQGEDAEAIDQEQADDNARADALGLTYDSDGRQARSGTGPMPEPERQEDNQPAGATT